jgi:ribosomal-protein-alanine N-acetyltransferase
VRAASEDDAPAMAFIHAAAFDADEAWPAESILALLRSSGTFGLLAADAGMLLFRRAADEAEILTLAVIPAMRGRGVATSLLRVACDALRASDVRALLLEVRASNTEALGLYHRFDFRQVGLRKRYYSDGSDALIMRASIDSA